MAGILLLADDRLTLKVAEVSLSSDIVKTLEQAAASGIEEFRAELSKSSILAQAVEAGMTLQVTSKDISEAILPGPLASQVMEIMELGKETSIVTPLHRRGKIIGILMVMAPKLAGHFIPSVRNLARHISAALELAYEHTERKRAEEALQKSEEHFRFLIENAPDVIGILDANGCLRYVSPSAEKVTGYSVEELIGKNSFEFVHPEDIDLATELFAKGIQIPGHSASMEIRFRRKDGLRRFAEFIAMYLLDTPSVGGIVLNCRDITERKLAEDALQQSEEKFRAIVENAPDQFVIVERDGTISFVNYVEPGFKLMEVLGTSVYEYVEAELADIYRETQEKVFETRQPERIEVVSVMGRTFDCRIAPIEKNSRVDHLMVILTDISDRKQAEEALKAK